MAIGYFLKIYINYIMQNSLSGMEEVKQDFTTQNGNFLDISDLFISQSPINSLEFRSQKKKSENPDKNIKHKNWKGTQLQRKHILFYLEYLSQHPFKVFPWKQRRQNKFYALMQEYLSGQKNIQQCVAYDQFITKKNHLRYKNFKEFITSQAQKKLKNNQDDIDHLKKIKDIQKYIQEQKIIMQEEQLALQIVGKRIRAKKLQTNNPEAQQNSKNTM